MRYGEKSGTKDRTITSGESIGMRPVPAYVATRYPATDTKVSGATIWLISSWRLTSEAAPAYRQA